MLYPIYRIALLIYHDFSTSYLAAVLAAFAFYALEQTSGLIGMDHDDVAFTAYVGASVWAYYEYRVSARPGRWLVAVGAFAGAAVLCKWLTGLVVYAAWGLDILSDPARRRVVMQYVHAGLSVVAATVVWLPWQLFTAYHYPLESAYERSYNARHFTEALEGHAHDWYYHFALLPIHYGAICGLLVLGVGWALFSADRHRPVGLLLAIAGLIYAFFTLAATKMYSYTYVVSPLLFVIAARPLALFIAWLPGRFAGRPWGVGLATAGLLLAVVLLDARPWGVYTVHFQEGSYGLYQEMLQRPARTANARLYAQLGEDLPAEYLIINVPGSEEVQAMFHSGRTVYSWPPSEAQVRSLIQQGWRITAFDSHHNQQLPTYVRATPGFRLIWGAPE